MKIKAILEVEELDLDDVTFYGVGFAINDESGEKVILLKKIFSEEEDAINECETPTQFVIPIKLGNLIDEFSDEKSYPLDPS